MTSSTPRSSSETGFGAVGNVLAAAGIAAALDGGLALFGDPSLDGGSRAPTMFAPPGIVVGAVWVVLFALLGLARWRLIRLGSAAGCRGAGWTVAFIGVCALYPVYTLGLRSPIAGLIGNLGTALFAVALGVYVWRIDQRSAGAFALVVAWLSYATVAIAAELGWLPVATNGP